MKEMDIHLRCPYCNNDGTQCPGETLASRSADVDISVKCGKCGRIYNANPYKRETWKSRPQKRNGRK